MLAGTMPKIVPMALAALLGAALVQCLPELPPVWTVLVLAAAVSLLALHQPARVWPMALSITCLAFAWTVWVADSRLQQRLPLSAVGTQAMMEGRVTGFPRSLPQRTEFSLQVHHAESAPFLEGKILRVRWFGEVPELRAGSRWRLIPRVQDPRGTANPGSFDSQRQMLLEDIHGVAYVREAGLAMQLERGRGLHAFRATLADAMVALGGRQDTRFTRALSIGDIRDLSDEDWRLLRVGGLSHLVAISGFHVGMVAAFAGLLMLGTYRLLPGLIALCERPRAVALTAALAAFGYAALAGFAVATVRTALMIGVIAFMQVLRRADSAVQSFCIALLAVLVFDPLAVLDAGFWLSFIGVAGLLLCLPMRRLQGREWLAAYVRTQWISFLILLPLCLWFFAENSWWSPLVNLLAIPLVSLLLVPISLLAMVLASSIPSLAAVLLEANARLCDVGMQGLARIDAGGWMQGISWVDSVLLLLLLCLGSALMLIPRQRWLQAAGLLCWMPVLLPMRDLPSAGSLQVTAFDVGRVQAVLLETRRHSMLYLSGSRRDLSPAWFEDLGRLLQVEGVSQLDIVVAPRHGAIPEGIARRYPSARWLSPDGPHPCDTRKPLSWDGVTLSFLHPPPYFPDEGVDSRCVLWAEAGDDPILVTPGISPVLQRRLLARHPMIQHTRLWLTHERADSRWDPGFLSALQDADIWWTDRVRGQGPVIDVSDSAGRYRVREHGQLQARIGADSRNVESVVPRRFREHRPRYWQTKLTD